MYRLAKIWLVGCRTRPFSSHFLTELVGWEPDASDFNFQYFPQLLSPLAEGTFQRAILQSGTALGISWGAPNTPQKAKICLQKSVETISNAQALQYAAVLSTGVGCGEGCGVYSINCIQCTCPTSEQCVFEIV